MAPGDRRVDRAMLRETVGAKVRMANPDEVLALTGYPVGAVSPFAHPSPLPILLDRSLGRHEVLWMSGGTTDTLMALSWSDLRRLTGGGLVDVTTVLT